MPGSDGSVIIKIVGDNSGFQEALESIGTVAQRAGKLAAAAFTATGIGVAAAAKAAINAGMTFEASMSSVAAISGATADELEALESTAKELGAETQFSSAQAADALSYMALAGWDAQQSIAALPGVLDLAAASGMDLAAASDMVTDYLSAFGMAADQSTYFADMLAYAQSNANTTAAALGESFKNCAANMSAAGQDVETTTALLSMMANQGLKGSEAGTALAAVMRDLTAQMDDGAIKIGNASVAVMDIDGNYRDLTDVLLDVESATNGMGDAQKAMALSSTFTSDSIRAVNMVLNSGVDEAAAFEQELRNSTGTATDMANTMNDNLKGRIEEFGGALESVGIQCYEAMEGSLKRGVEAATESIGELSDEMSSGRLKDSTEKIAESFGDIIEKTGELAGKGIPKVVNGFADLVDHGNELVSITGSVAAGYASFKVATKYIQPLAKGWQAATAALEAHEAASRLTLVALNGGLPVTTTLVGVLTGKITLATAAQAAWNKVALVNPYIPIAAAVSAATVGIGLYISAQETEIEKLQEEADKAAEAKQAFDDLLESRQESINSSMLEIDNAEFLISKFEALADSTGRVKEGTNEYKEAKRLAAQINAVAPGAIEDIEEEGKAYLQIADSIDLVIAKKRLEAQIDANQSAYTEAIKKKSEAEENYVSSRQTVHEKYLAWVDAENAAQENASSSNSLYYQSMVEDAKMALDSAIKTHQDYADNLSSINQTINDQERLIGATAAESADEINAALLESEGALTRYTGANAKACMQQMIDNENALQSKRQQVREGIQLTENEIENAERSYQEQIQITAQGISDLISTAREGTSGAEEASKAISDAMVDGLGDLGSQLSEEGREALVTAIASMEIEASNAKQVGENLNAGIYDGIFSSLGLPEEAGRSLMQACIDASAEAAEINSPSRVMAEQGMYLDQGLGNGIAENAGLATTPASTLMQNVLSVVQGGLVNLPVIGGLFGSLFGSGISGSSYMASGAASSVGEEAVSSARTSLDNMSGVGFTSASLIGSGLLSNKSAASSAAQSVMTSAASSVKSNVRAFEIAGKASMSAYASAIKSGGKPVVTAVQAVNKSSAAAITAQKLLYTQAANAVMTTLNAGIKSKQGVITATTKAIGKAGAAGVSGTKSSYQSAGYNLSLGISAGIRSGRPSVISAAVSVATSAIAAAQSALGINSPSKVAEREIGQWYDKGWAHGIIKYAYTIHDAISTVADDTYYEMEDAVYAQTARISATLTGLPRSNQSANAKTIIIDYHPEQKCDEPVSLRDMDATNRKNARYLRRLITNA